jgi:Polyketide cyclase / dehydrase and lipid transport
MRSVSVVQRFEGTVHEAETCWYDTGRWAYWVDGLDRVIAVHGPWPEPGSSVTWQSGPAGRGTVTERVTGHDPLSGMTAAVEDDSITGTQAVAFDPVGGGVEVALTLEYEIKQRGLFTALVDFLFIRRAMDLSLRKTLGAFGAELQTRRAA